MIIVTSIPPNSPNSVEAIKTWHSHGKIFSLNSKKEMPVLGYKNIAFAPTHRIMEWNGRPLVSINAMVDLAIEQGEDLMILNSDIIINNLPEFNQDGITILTRCDYSDGAVEQGRLYEHGFDTFHFPNKFLSLIPPSIYCLGNTWTDYFLPYALMQKGIPVYWPQGKCIFHKTHSFQWDFDEWVYMAEFFKLFFKVDKHISLEQLAINILADIKNRSIK